MIKAFRKYWNGKMAKMASEIGTFLLTAGLSEEPRLRDQDILLQPPGMDV